LAVTAVENIFSGNAGEGYQCGSRFMLDPATGTLIVGAELDLKIRKAIMREVRRIKFRLYRKRAGLNCQELASQVLGSLLRIAGQCGGYLANLLGNRHAGRHLSHGSRR
jgi:hypothetical protein